ncbi:MAG TPA: LPXTG cell wall anchor domain-containing protein, partial [Thermoplasmata archaeon]|nr:LPXTG cell wall anchor domain-containing protein [Thermoplasmata archaeon]
SYRCKFHPATMMGTIVIRNATNPPTGTPGDNTAVIIGGVLVILLLGVAVYWVFGRKKKA